MLKSKCLITLGLIILCLTWATPIYADNHEVDMSYVNYDSLSGDGLASNSWCKLGQRLVIPDRYVSAIGYHVWRIGNPTGNVTFTIYNATTDELIVSRLWGDASNLVAWGAGSLQVVTLDDPIKINGEVRLCVEYYGGDKNNYCGAGYYVGDLIPGEFYTNYRYGQWHDIGEAEEGAYHYTWIDEEDLKSDNPARGWIVAPIALAVGGIWFYARRRTTKRQ